MNIPRGRDSFSAASPCSTYQVLSQLLRGITGPLALQSTMSVLILVMVGFLIGQVGCAFVLALPSALEGRATPEPVILEGKGEPCRENQSEHVVAKRKESVAVTNHELIAAIIQVESGGNPKAKSPKGARGLMQIMPRTWADMTDQPWSRAYEPVLNVQVGTKYLRWIERTLTRWMKKRPTLEQVLAAYNGGIGRLRNGCYRVKKMPRETREYVSLVLTELEGRKL